MLDPEAWVFDEGYTILAREFRVRTTSADIAQLIDRTFGACATSVSDDAAIYAIRVTERAGHTSGQLTVAGRDILNGIEPSQAFESLVWHVMNDVITGLQDFLVVHAGAVVSPAGAVVVLPGPSGSGKTTLTAGLVRSGFGYLSDEMAAFTPETGEVLAVPRALSLKSGTLEALGLDPPVIPASVSALLHRDVPLRPNELRAGSLAAGGRLATIIAPTYRKGEPTALKAVSRAEGLAILARNAFNLDTFGGSRAIRLLGGIVASTSCYRLTAGSLAESVDAIRSVCLDDRDR